MSKVDWSICPDAEFFAYGEFRKRGEVCSKVPLVICFDEMLGEYFWEEGIFTLEKCKKASDYEERPASVVKDPVCTSEATPDVTTGAIKSDGGSSSYYDIQIPDWLIDLIVERGYVKTEELIEVMGDSFNQGTILKSLVRLNSLLNGVGKAGNSVEYECNKIIYYANRIKEEESR